MDPYGRYSVRFGGLLRLLMCYVFVCLSVRAVRLSLRWFSALVYALECFNVFVCMGDTVSGCSHSVPVWSMKANTPWRLRRVSGESSFGRFICLFIIIIISSSSSIVIIIIIITTKFRVASKKSAGAPLEGYGRRKLFCIELILHTPCIPVSMSDFIFWAGGVMNLHVEDGVSERAQHWNGDTKGHAIIYAEYFPPTVPLGHRVLPVLL